MGLAVSIERWDGERPDCIILLPYKLGKTLIWDATCIDTFLAGNLIASATHAESDACSADESKIAKYSVLFDRFHFVPVAIETSGVLGPQ